MKKHISLIAAIFFSIATRSWGAAPDQNDAWDTRQGIVIVTNSPLSNRIDSDIRNIFGGTFGVGGLEGTVTYFSDSAPDGFVHFVQWKTPEAIQLTGMRLFAAGDGVLSGNQREMAKFILEVKPSGSFDFVTLVEFSPSHPYMLMDATNSMLLETNFALVQASEFRAKFVQFFTASPFDGPRIIELDAIIAQTNAPYSEISHTDVFDVNNAIHIVNNSPVGYFTDIRSMFGYTNRNSVESEHTVFSDYLPPGTTNFVEWQTRWPVELSEINLFAGGDGPQYFNEREFALFNLKAKIDDSNDYTLLASFAPSHPYLLLSASNNLVYSTYFKSFIASTFRAEFVTFTAGRGYDGPRIIELDGVGKFLKQPVNFTPEPGVFTNSITVTLTPNRNNGVVRFTLDGSMPSSTSSTYEKPLVLKRSTTIKANLFVDDQAVSDVLSASYVLSAVTATPYGDISDNDLFDISNSNRIVDNTPVGYQTDIRSMFGYEITNSLEGGHVIFSDNTEPGSTNFVEWQTLFPVELNEIHLFAGGDGPSFGNQREFGHFNLEAKINGESNYTRVASFEPSHPYLALTSSNTLVYSTTFNPVVAKDFRAEFTTFSGGRGYDGPRIIELDGFGRFLIPTLTIAPDSCEFTNSITVSITAIQSDGTIRYTVNGSTPTVTSLIYDKPIELTATTTLKVVYFRDNQPASDEISATFVRVYAINDGISNDWRKLYFGDSYRTDPRVGASEDPDKDGSNNLEEFLASTDPLDPSSVLKIRSISMAPVIVWSSIPNKAYQLIRKDDLTTTNWIVVSDSIVATNSITTYIDLTSTNKKAFYWISPRP